jgi:hypothetical protein
MLRKVWDAFINKRERIISRDHAKTLQSQKKFDNKLQNAQLSAGKQIDNRIDSRLVDLEGTVKSIIKDTIKSRSIKKEFLPTDSSSFFEVEDSLKESYNQPLPHQHQHVQQQQQQFLQNLQNQANKRFRSPDLVDLRSPNQNRRKKNQDSRSPFLNQQGYFYITLFYNVIHTKN